MDKFFFKEVSAQTIGTIVGGIILSLMFFTFNDFIHKPPNISGQWYFVNETTDTSYSKFKTLKVYYKVMLIQQNNLISGHGEKIQDELNGNVTEYSGKGKIQIQISGNLKHNFISKDKLTIYYSEEGGIRKSSTFHNLIRFSDKKMNGGFSSTIANSSGKTSYARRLEDL